MTIDVFDLARAPRRRSRLCGASSSMTQPSSKRALNTFREAMQYISAAYYPASLVFYPMESNLGYRPGVSKELLACLDDEQVNVYRDICNQLVLPSVSKEKPDVIGISIGTQMQLIAGMTFCKMIKETFPAHPRGGRGERHYSASGRAAASRPILYGSLRLGDSCMKASMRCSG